MQKLSVIKVGGKIVEQEETLSALLSDFSNLAGNKLLVHGGGRSATKVASDLGIETKMAEGRRITDKKMLEVVTMVYGGLVNKNIVAGLQQEGINALGLTGADLGLVRSHKRPVKTIDYGFVGDVEEVNGAALVDLIKANVVPVVAPLSFSMEHGLLNTNADTIAGETAKSLSRFFDVSLIYCFEKKGVLLNENDDDSVISEMNYERFEALKADGVIQGGMIPKLENAFSALNAGVSRVVITRSDELGKSSGTTITL